MPERAARDHGPRALGSSTKGLRTIGPPPPKIPVSLHRLPNRAPTLVAPRSAAVSHRPAGDATATRGRRGWRSAWLAPLAFLVLAATIAVGEAFLSGRETVAPPAGQDRADRSPDRVSSEVSPSIASPSLRSAPHHTSPGGDSADPPAPAGGVIGQSEALVGLDPLETYLAALSQSDYPQARQVSSGPARAYVEYLIALHRVLDEEPPSSSLTLVEPLEPARELAADGYLAVGGRAEFADYGGDFSYFLSDFKLRSGPAGTWMVESYRRDGIDIGALLAVGDSASGAEANDVLISVMHAFLQPAEGEAHTLVLVYRIDNRRGGPVSAFPYGATFQPSEGSEVEAEFAAEEVVVLPERSAEDLLFVQPGHLEGSIVGELLDLDTKAIWTVEIPIPHPSTGE